MIDLPTIVEAIRRQRPGVVPEWLENGGLIGFFDARDGRCIRPDCVEAMLVGWLYSALMRKQSTQSTSRRRGYESCGVWIGPTNGHWYAKTGKLHAKAVDFGDDDLALVRALCHAIGIEVGDA